MDTNSHLLVPIWAAETEVVVTEPQEGFRYYGQIGRLFGERWSWTVSKITLSPQEVPIPQVVKVNPVHFSKLSDCCLSIVVNSGDGPATCLMCNLIQELSSPILEFTFSPLVVAEAYDSLREHLESSSKSPYYGVVESAEDVEKFSAWAETLFSDPAQPWWEPFELLESE